MRRKLFCRLGFIKWNISYFPIIEMSPYYVEPGLVREQWMWMFRNIINGLVLEKFPMVIQEKLNSGKKITLIRVSCSSVGIIQQWQGNRAKRPCEMDNILAWLLSKVIEWIFDDESCKRTMVHKQIQWRRNGTWKNTQKKMVPLAPQTHYIFAMKLRMKRR